MKSKEDVEEEKEDEEFAETPGEAPAPKQRPQRAPPKKAAARQKPASGGSGFKRETENKLKRLIAAAESAREAGDMARAEKNYTAAMTVLEQGESATNPLLGLLAMSLAAVHGANENWEATEADLKKAIEIFDANTMPPGQYAEVYGQLAEVFLKTDRLEEAENMCKKSLELFKKHFAPKEAKSHLALGFQNMGIIKAKLEKYSEAEAFLKRAVEIFAQVFDNPTDPILITATVRLASLKADTGDVEACTKLLMGVVDTVTRVAPGKAGVPYLNLVSTIFFDREMYAQAEPVLKQCVEAFSGTASRKDKVIHLNLQHDLISIQRELGRSEEAEAAEEKLKPQFVTAKAPVPLASSRYMRTMKATLKNNCIVLEIELKNKHPLKRVPTTALSAGVLLEFVSPNAADPATPLTQQLLLTPELVKGRKIEFTSEALAQPLEGICTVQVRAYADESKAQLLGVHQQWVAGKAEPAELMAKDDRSLLDDLDESENAKHEEEGEEEGLSRSGRRVTFSQETK